MDDAPPAAAEPHVSSKRRREADELLEIVSTVLLALATVATAWSGYQATRWSGEQAQSYSKANAARVESARASTQAGQLTIIDVSTFTSWANAYATKNALLTDFYFKRFRKEFKPAVDAWIATKPLKNPSAPLTPFAMPQYKLAATVEADRLAAEANRHSAQAALDNQRGDNYVLCVVLFATALFFAGVSTKLSSVWSRGAILGLGCVVFLGALVWILTFPTSIAV